MQHTHEILEKIQTYQTIILHRHMNPDPDAIGSQVGLKEIIQTNQIALIFPENLP